jgi:hypothetical protein
MYFYRLSRAIRNRACDFRRKKAPAPQSRTGKPAGKFKAVKRGHAPVLTGGRGRP